METYIILALYAGVSVGFIILNDAATGKTDLNKKRCKFLLNFNYLNLKLINIF